MKNTFGNSISVTLFGESHGEEIGATLDGIAPGIKIDYDFIEKKLAERRPKDSLSTSRREPDKFRIISGAYNGYTTGTPLTILIKNENVKSSDYDTLRDTPRPSHADFSAECKYHGFQDTRGGGHFSGRITAPLVAVGAILLSALNNKGIKIGTHISSLHGISDREFGNYEADIELLSGKDFPALSEKSEEIMKNEILTARNMGDSVGGVLESAIIGVPQGVGEVWFDSVESVISHILFSVGGIKGVEFGRGFEIANLFGSEANDELRTDGKTVYTTTNNNGGIVGGITNGMPIIVRSAVKPTPSIYKNQKTVKLSTMENTEIKIEGRHDPAIIHRVKSVVDATLAIAVADMLALRYGTDYLKG